MKTRNTLLVVCALAMVPASTTVLATEDLLDDNYVAVQLPARGKRSLHPLANDYLAAAFRCRCEIPCVDDLALRALMNWVMVEYLRGGLA